MSTGNFLIPQLDNLQLLFDLANPNVVQGSTWKDQSGKGNDGVVSGTITYADGSAIFAGAQEVTIPNIQHPNGSTIFIQMKSTDQSVRRNPYNQAYGGYGTITLEVSNYVNSYFGDSGANATPYTGTSSTLPYSNNEFFNMTIARDTVSRARYKNGIFIEDQAHSYGVLTTDNNSIIIGNGYVGFFIGEIQTVALWDVRLTPEEIIKVNNNYKQKMI
jgi:hypothetical protein